MEIAAAGLPCLLAALACLPSAEPLRQEIMRTPAHVLYLLHRTEGGQLVGAVLHGKPGLALTLFVQPDPAPRLATRRQRRRQVSAQQLDLFAIDVP